MAYVLSRAIQKIGAYDLILTGRQAGDWDSGQVGLILAEWLGIPAISLARSIKINRTVLLVEKTVPVGYEVVEAGLPALVTVSNEVGELRYVSRTKMMALAQAPGPDTQVGVPRTWSTTWKSLEKGPTGFAVAAGGHAAGMSDHRGGIAGRKGGKAGGCVHGTIG